METRQKILNTLKQEIAKETGLPVSQIDDSASFYSLGLDSISSVFILDKVEKQLKIEMNPRPPVIFPDLQNLAADIGDIFSPDVFKNKVLIILSGFHGGNLMKNITKSDIVDFLKQQVALECALSFDEVDTHVEFVEFRMDSLKAVYITDRLEKFIGTELSPLYFWDHPTIDSLSEFIDIEIVNTWVDTSMND